jgi:hypothetical protein
MLLDLFILIVASLLEKGAKKEVEAKESVGDLRHPKVLKNRI